MKYLTPKVEDLLFDTSSIVLAASVDESVSSLGNETMDSGDDLLFD